MTFMKKLSENTTLRQNIYSFITVFLWASAFPLTKSIDGYFSPYSLGLLRCFTASLLLIILAKAIHIRKPFCKKHIMYFTLSGALGFSMYMIFFQRRSHYAYISNFKYHYCCHSHLYRNRCQHTVQRKN